MSQCSATDAQLRWVHGFYGTSSMNGAAAQLRRWFSDMVRVTEDAV